ESKIANVQEGKHPENDSGSGEDRTVVLLVHAKSVGSIIGKGVSHVRESRQTTNVQIWCSKETLDGSMEKTVTIRGPRGGLEKALAIVALQISDSQHYHPAQTHLWSPALQVRNSNHPLTRPHTLA